MSRAVRLAIPPHGLRGEVRLPFSKSLSNRQLVIGTHRGEAFTIRGLSTADDTQHLVQILKTIGYRIARARDEWNFFPPVEYPSLIQLYAGEGGTTLRFLLPLLSHLPLHTQVDAAPSLRRRPIFPLLHSLQKAGATIHSAPAIYPISITGNPQWHPRALEIDSSQSSQFVSALMLMAPHLASGTVIREKALHPATPAYREMTRTLLAQYGMIWHPTDDGWQLMQTQPLPTSWTFYGEADWSAASFFFGWAALGAFDGYLPLSPESLQPESRLFCALKWGYDCAFTQQGLHLRPTGAPLEGIDIAVEDYPDAILVLAVVAAFATSPSRLRGIHTLPYKETDRLRALTTELGKVGASLQWKRDELIIVPTSHTVHQSLTLESYGDHRMAMALSLIAARASAPIFILEPDCVAKSFPKYWHNLIRLGAQCEIF